jgi:hypothetical protein
MLITQAYAVLRLIVQTPGLTDVAMRLSIEIGRYEDRIRELEAKIIDGLPEEELKRRVADLTRVIDAGVSVA